MVHRRIGTFYSSLAAACGLLASACNSGGGGTTAASDSATDAATSGASTSTDSTASPPTTSGASLGGTDTGTQPTATSDVPDPSTVGETSAPDSETQSIDPSASTTDATTDATTGGTAPDDTTGAPDDTTGAPDDTTTGDTNGCVPSEQPEVSCDNLDNDCDGNVDNIDKGNDGICDCLNIGILGNVGFSPNADFEAWLMGKGTAVTRTLLQNNPGVVTPALLATYDVVLLDRIERSLSMAEAQALSDFVKVNNGGLITLIGYNYDNNNPAPERDRANTALAPFGLAYQGPYFGNNVVPTFDQNHPIGMDIFDVNFQGGIEPVDTGMQGTSAVFATTENKTAGLAHETAMGGRVVVWGDEWITFDSVWQGYVDVEDFWVNMVDWVRPQDICAAPQ